ncbi:MAG: response regulator transcription factor [Proteobacteria bacterium]|nr:response regulator transcription factor [Pseudomonadota bacterium]
MTKKTIIIADDHPVFRLGLAHIINGSEGFVVVAEAENKVELFTMLETTPCDIVILDMKMPGNRDGMGALQMIKEGYPEKKVMIMSQLCSMDLVEEALKLGADGYVTKNDIADMILPFLKSIGNGEKALSPRIQSLIIRYKDGCVDKLTPRENDILRLSVKGLRRKEIASQLNISVSTVNFHRQNLKEKLQADNMAGMIRIAYEKGLV